VQELGQQELAMQLGEVLCWLLVMQSEQKLYCLLELVKEAVLTQAMVLFLGRQELATHREQQDLGLQGMVSVRGQECLVRPEEEFLLALAVELRRELLATVPQK